MKWMMYLAVFGAVIVSVAVGVVVADRVMPQVGDELQAVPAVQQKSAITDCPGQKGVCPASRTRTSAHLQV